VEVADGAGRANYRVAMDTGIRGIHGRAGRNCWCGEFDRNGIEDEEMRGGVPRTLNLIPIVTAAPWSLVVKTGT